MIGRLYSVAAALLVATLAVAAGSALAGESGTHARACTPGLSSAGGVQKRTFCGPAKAVVKVGGATFALAQGECTKTSKYLTVNIGALYIGQTTKPKPDYLGLDVGQIPGSTSPPAGRDGTYTSGVVFSVNHGGKGYAVLAATVKLQGNRSHGTVSGKTLTGQPLTATFHC
ncbi:MAG TPA: hypothetical protein VMS63_05195 [Gaiellaceae bacterium]|jgi:hypothetical protein|nr:hypothetical protein [Gaiellaceae bacterium]